MALAAVALAFGVLGALVGLNRASGLAAVASVTLDTGTSAVFAGEEPGADIGDPDLYVQSQVDVFESVEVARRATSILAGGAYAPSVEEVQASTEIVRVPDGAEIEVTYTAEDEAAAVSGANAIVEGYRQLKSEGWSELHASAIAAVEEGLAVAEAESQASLEAIQPIEGDDDPDIDVEMKAIIAQLKEIDDAVLSGQDPEVQDLRRSILATEVDALETVFAEQLEGSRLSVASARLDAALLREATLRDRLIQLQVNSRTDGDGVSFWTPAESAESSSAGPLLAGIAGLVLGAFLGLAALYWWRGRRSTIVSPNQARRVLGYPMLSVVEPMGGGDAGRQLSAELLAEIRTRALWRESAVLGLVGADRESRMATATRLAWACADEGMRVLIVDGDLDRTADLDRIAVLGNHSDSGSDGRAVASLVKERQTPDGNSFHYLGNGTRRRTEPLDAADFGYALDVVGAEYDAVIVDIPPASLRQLREADLSNLTFVVVVRHDSSIGALRTLVKSFEERNVEPVGFVYAYDGLTSDSPTRSPTGESVSLPS